MPEDELDRIESDWTTIPGEYHWLCRASQQIRVVIEHDGHARVEIRCSNCHSFTKYGLTFSTMPLARDNDDVS